MVRWRQYQDDAAELFRELGCDVETDTEIAGARGKHLIDVVAGFSRFGLRQRWIVECKFWKRAIPKEKVLTFREIVEDVGADRGILLSEAGHQSGAIAVAKYTNMTLASLAKLREGAKEEILTLGLMELQRRSAHMKEFIFSLWQTERHEGGFSMSTVRPGVDGKLASQIGGAVSIIGTGVERAMLGAFPVPLRFLDDGNTLITAENLEEFVKSAAQLLDGLEDKIASLRQQIEPGE